jgi:Tol biopolymer transport system component
LLRFLVEQTLNGHAERLKDYTLGSEALGRGDGFDPRTDPIARVEASRLRSRLDLYYATEGTDDPVVITLPKGGYVPQFDYRPAVERARGIPPRRERVIWGALAFLGVFAVAAAIFAWRSAPRRSALAEVRLEITTPPTTDPVSLAVSPDGQQIVFVASAGQAPRLWLRALNDTAARPLAKTEQASLPFWSPDSKSLGFFADDRLKRIDIQTGVVEVLGRVAVPSGATWNQAGDIIYANTIDSPLTRISPNGAALGPVTALTRGETGHRGPQFLPDGRHFIYYAMGNPTVRGIYIADLDHAITRRLFDADTPAIYVAHCLLYVHQGTLFAQGFDPDRAELKGHPMPVAEHVTSGTRANIAALSASTAGPIAYRTGSPGGKRQFVWFDRAGQELGRIGNPHSFGPSYASMSPDNRRLAVQRTGGGNTDIWLLDLDRDAPIRFTSGPEPDIAPLWSPDGERIIFSSRRGGGPFNLYEQPVTGAAAQELLVTDQTKSATDWSRDGRFLLFRSLDPKLNWDVWAMPMVGERKPFAVVRSQFEERDAQFSPDGKWISYQSDESGRFEVYVAPFRRPGQRMRISASGGVQGFWRRDGKELFYLALDGQVVAVGILPSSRADSLETGQVLSLFGARVGSLQDISLNHYLVSADGQRFLLDTVVEEDASPIIVILNWKAPAN